MTDLERVARAIRDVEFKIPGAGGLKGSLNIPHGHAMEIARAAVAALMDVSERSLGAGEGIMDMIDATGPNTPASRLSEFRVGVQAMLRSILEEKG